MKNVLIFGATSAIAEATARRFAQRGDRLYLVARRTERLDTLARDLAARGAPSVRFEVLDICELDKHEAVITSAMRAMGGIDVALIAHGTLPDQRQCERDFQSTLTELNINAISTISLLTHLANSIEAFGQGSIVCITSVAGDRGRQSNYVYGTAKGAVSIFLQGLRNRLSRFGIQVLTIKPGFVDTPMTKQFEKNMLWAQADAVARAIDRAIEKRRNVIYVPWFWGPIMLVIRNIPEYLFSRMRL